MSSASSPKARKRGTEIRRRHPRYNSDFRLQVSGVKNHQPFTVMGRCTVFSEGGVGGIMAGQLPIGDVVNVQFMLPNASAPMNTRAVVRHNVGFYYGMEFVSLSPSELETVRNYCKSLPQRG